MDTQIIHHLPEFFMLPFRLQAVENGRITKTAASTCISSSIAVADPGFRRWGGPLRISNAEGRAREFLHHADTPNLSIDSTCK